MPKSKKVTDFLRSIAEDIVLLGEVAVKDYLDLCQTYGVQFDEFNGLSNTPKKKKRVRR